MTYSIVRNNVDDKHTLKAGRAGAEARFGKMLILEAK